MSTLSEELVSFTLDLQYDELPAEVVERIRLHSLDLIGVCLLGAPMNFSAMLRSTVALGGGVPESTLIGGKGLKLPAPSATWYNGGLAHGNEFDDTYSIGRWHGSAPTVPPALAIAESLHSDGKAFITALAAGLEAGCRLTRAAPALVGRGFHSTCTAGIFAATLAVGKLMALNHGELSNALGISGSFASGNTEFLSDPEAWAKRVQVGHAGQSAILAARLAATGFGGSRTIFEGRYGYFRSYAGEGGYDLSGITKDLGRDWQLLRLYPKRYPCDHIAQGYVHCAIALGKMVDLSDIQRVECIVHPLASAIMFEPRELRYQPGNGWSARWSMPFNIAVALTDRAVSVDCYSDERAVDSDTRALMAKVIDVCNSDLAFPVDYPAWVRLFTKDERVLEEKELKVAGSPENPMPREEYESKFMANAVRCIEYGQALEIVHRMRHLEQIDDMAKLATLYS